VAVARGVLSGQPADGWGTGVTLLPRTALKVETSRSSRLLTGCFADPAPPAASPSPSPCARERHATQSNEEVASALREALRPLPLRVLDADADADACTRMCGLRPAGGGTAPARTGTTPCADPPAASGAAAVAG
jgi:hypothetical protein